MKTKEQIEIAEKLIENLNDYVALARVQKKLKVENVEAQIENVTEFIINNAEKL